MDGSENQHEKVMVTIIWVISVFLVLEILPENELFNSAYFIEHIITQFEQKSFSAIIEKPT